MVGDGVSWFLLHDFGAFFRSGRVKANGQLAWAYKDQMRSHMVRILHSFVLKTCTEVETLEDTTTHSSAGRGICSHISVGALAFVFGCFFAIFMEKSILQRDLRESYMYTLSRITNFCLSGLIGWQYAFFILTMLRSCHDLSILSYFLFLLSNEKPNIPNDAGLRVLQGPSSFFPQEHWVPNGALVEQAKLHLLFLLLN